MKDRKCQRCGKPITEAERQESSQIASFLVSGGLCPSCLDVAKKIEQAQDIRDHGMIREPEDNPSDGWRIFGNLEEYQRVFDEIGVEYNCLEPPTSYPAAGHLFVGGVADSCGAWFIYMYMDRATELLEYCRTVDEDIARQRIRNEEDKWTNH